MALTKTPSELTAADLTITTAAQPNITSLGTLTALQVDNVNINGNTISSTDTNGNIVLTANGTGNVNVNTDVLAIQGTEGESASLALQADESDDAGDEWRITTNTNQTLSIQNNISGSGVDHMTFTPHATVGSSTVTIPGKVGIGTNAPTHMLHVVDGNNYAVLGDTQSNSTMSLRMADTAAYPVEVQAYGNDLRINTASSSGATPTVKMLVQYTGYVGIGETSPDNKLHITGGDWNNAHIKIERTDNGSANDPGIVFKSAAGANDSYGLGSIWFQNALDGNAYAMIRARTNDASGTSGKIEFITSTSAVGNATTPRMVINADGAINFYSDSSGGTPNLLLDTNGIASFKPKDNTANIASFDTDTAGTTSGYIAFKTRGTYRGYIGNGSALSSNYALDTDFHIRAEGARLVFLTNGNAPKIVIDGTAGNLLPHGDATQNLGSTSKRWDNLYVNDMHFSNEGSDGNDVDGTTGDWTLQEGEEHLYIINNKSGKKFKFSLEEVQ